jgi:hypothetical protein
MSDKIRSRCKDCGGGSICEHDRRRSACKDCKDIKRFIIESRTSSSSKLKRNINALEHTVDELDQVKKKFKDG